METRFNQTKDVPPFAAIAFFLTVLGGLMFFEHREQWQVIFSTLDKVANANMVTLCLLFVSLSINFVTTISMFTSSFGLRKQGSRLAILTGRRNSGSSSIAGFIQLLGIASVSGLLLLPFVKNLETAGSEFVLIQYVEAIRLFIVSQFGLSIAVITLLVARTLAFDPRRWLLSHGLPPYPIKKNSIVLGSTGEHE